MSSRRQEALPGLPACAWAKRLAANYRTSIGNLLMLRDEKKNPSLRNNGCVGGVKMAGSATSQSRMGKHCANTGESFNSFSYKKKN